MRRLAIAGLLALALVAGCSNALEKARASRTAGDDAAAERYYREAISGGADDAGAARAELAAMLCERGRSTEDPAAAEALYREAVQLDGQNPDGYLGVSRSLMRQGRRAEALALLEQAPDCTGCERLLGLAHVEDGELLLSKGDLPGARAAFDRAVELLPEEPAGYLGQARTHERAGSPEALAQLEAGAAHLREGSEEVDRFRQARQGIALACAADGDTACIDRTMAIEAPAAGGDPWFELQLSIAEELAARKDIDTATERLAGLLATQRDAMGEAVQAQIRVRLLKLYEQRAAMRLRDEEAKGAEQDLIAAQQLDPRDASLALRRILAVAGQGRLDDAVAMLNEVPEQTDGRIEVLAVLLALRVEEQLERGNLEIARKLLAKAQEASPDQPEVHLAAAQILAVSELEGVSDRERARLEKYGLARYEDGYLRYGEALSEVDWARKQIQSLGLGYEFRGPATERRIERLAAAIQANYPFEVGFRAQGDTLLQLRSAKGKQMRVEVRAPGGLKTKVQVPAAGVVEVLVEEPGLVLLETDAWRAAVFTEPYTLMTVSL